MRAMDGSLQIFILHRYSSCYGRTAAFHFSLMTNPAVRSATEPKSSANLPSWKSKIKSCHKGIQSAS